MKPFRRKMQRSRTWSYASPAHVRVLVKLKANVRRGNKLMWDFEFRVYVTYESVHVEDPVESVYLGEG